jgi:hypothetical protein
VQKIPHIELAKIKRKKIIKDKEKAHSSPTHRITLDLIS